MKKLTIVLGLSAVLLPVAASFAATGVDLYNGGFGQAADNTQGFGVAVCNGGTKTVAQSVPVSVAVGGQTATTLSASSIKPSGCEYSYLNYSDLAMQAGKTYSVTVTIDPGRTLISNTNNQATYAVTVPGTPVAVAPSENAAHETANVNFQSGDFFSMVFDWLKGFFGGQ